MTTRTTIGEPALRARLNRGESLGDRIMKVNHAGERGAISIYTGQILLARLTAAHLVPMLIEMRQHESRHLGVFAEVMHARGVARCRSYLLCHVGGLLLGLATGLGGARTIHATTHAIEDVVVRHLREQLAALSESDPRAAAAVAAIMEDEAAHLHQAEAATERSGLLVGMTEWLVANATEAIIWLGMRL